MSYRPPAPIPLSKRPGAIPLLFSLWRNPLSICGDRHFVEPIVSEKTIIGQISIVSCAGRRAPCPGRECRQLPEGSKTVTDPAARAAHRPAHFEWRHLEDGASRFGAVVYAERRGSAGKCHAAMQSAHGPTLEPIRRWPAARYERRARPSDIRNYFIDAFLRGDPNRFS